MHIYFSGVGGVAIGPLALLAKQAGYEVSGSDHEESTNSEIIASQGIEVIYDQSRQAISEIHNSKPIDWLVHTAALTEDSEELQFAKQHKIKTSKRDELLNIIIKEAKQRLIAVSGTHGKTTTTGMIVWLFKQLEEPVSYSIGTNISFGQSAEFDKEAKYFVYEADEFDRNMLNFKPHIAAIPSLDYDHPDTYPTIEEYVSAFEQFKEQSDFTLSWDDMISHQTMLENEITLPGAHNRSNAALAVRAVHKAIKADTAKLVKLINSFPGTERRFEKIKSGLYSDYGHHPVEIEATIQLALELNKEVVVVYQPHQNIRQHEIQASGGYGDCFDKAHSIYWLDTFLSREDPELSVLEPEEIYEDLNSAAKTTEAAMDDELTALISEHLDSGRLVLCMSAGDLDKWLKQTFAS